MKPFLRFYILDCDITFVKTKHIPPPPPQKNLIYFMQTTLSHYINC